jgi:hypothetical protein
MRILPKPAKASIRRNLYWPLSQLGCVLLVLTGVAGALPRDNIEGPPAKFQIRIEAPESDLLAAVAEVAQDQIVHGTYSYDKERILYGAHSAKEAHVFGTWKGSGNVFYKVANNVLSPRYFKDTNDIGTISLRYVVQSADANASILQIDAVFVDARTVHHPSLGNVESSEFAAIQQHLRTIQEKHQQTGALDAMATPHPAAPAVTQTTFTAKLAPPPEASSESLPDLQKHISALRHEVELRVKDQGAQLKSAPFHGAATLRSLPAQAEVLIVVLTPYWYGVETEDGHSGWIHHSQLEPLP